MGKHKHEKHAKHAGEHKEHVGCVWSIFLQALRYQHWHNVKKRLPHKRHGGNKQAKGDGDSANKSEVIVGNELETNFPEVNNSKVKHKVRQDNPAKKNSVKARIKALISDEMSKRKGRRHHRNSSYPEQSQLARTGSIQRLEPSDEDLLTEIILGDGNPTSVTGNNENSDATSSMDTQLPKQIQEKITSGECQAMLTCDDLEHNEVENEKQLIENLMLLQKKLEAKEQALLEQKLTSTEEITSEADASLPQSKAFLEALNLINANKEFFLRVLHDPSSVVAHHVHNRQPLSVKTGFTKSETFPSPGSSRRRDPEASKFKNNHDLIESHEQEEGEQQNGDQAQNLVGHESTEDVSEKSLSSTIHENRADGIQKPNQEMAEISGSSSSSSVHNPKNQVRNEAVIRRFKDLRQKIKHAFKESKNEKHRNTMNAALHKIPRRQVFSPDLKNKILDHFKDPNIKNDGGKSLRSSYENNHAALIGKTRLNRLTRNSSLSDSLDRYCQLYESSFSGEAKQQTSESLKLRRDNAALLSKTTPKSLGRIFSLPELKSYHYQSEDPYGFSPGMPVRIPVEKTVSVSGLDEQDRDIPITSEYTLRLDSIVESHQEKLIEVSGSKPVKGDQVGSASVVCSNENAEEDKVIDESPPETEQDIEPVTTKLVKPIPASVHDSKFEEVIDSKGKHYLSEELMLQGDLEVQLESIHSGQQDSLTCHQHESSMDTPIVAHGSDLDIVGTPSYRNIDILQAQVATKDKAKFDYVRNVLDLSGFSRNESLGAWYSDDQPVDPSVYEEVDDCIPIDTDLSGNEDGDSELMMLLFDLINEVLMEIYEQSYSYYPKPLSSLCHIHPMPAGHHVLKDVWENISWYLRFTPEVDQSLDSVVSRDLAKGDEWMNLQFDTECVALEVEELIFVDLLDEVILT